MADFLQITDTSSMVHVVNVAELVHIAPGLAGVGSAIVTSQGEVIYHADNPATFVAGVVSKVASATKAQY